jgi:hypothetical protein
MPIIDIKSLSATPLGTPWIEVGDTSNLEVVPHGDVNPDNYVFSSSNPNVALISGVKITGIGFGVTTISASHSRNNQVVARLTLYVGSVVIVGADGNSWRIFPDGVCRQVLPNDISPRMQKLETHHFLFAEVENKAIYDITYPMKGIDHEPARASSTAVTCYLLNLAAVAKPN